MRELTAIARGQSKSTRMRFLTTGAHVQFLKTAASLKASMAKKSVLVTYLERKKVFHLEETAPEGTGDIASLKKQFIVQFKFESHVKLDITFQRYVKKWDSLVDLDEDDEVDDGDRLNAVVTPILTDSTPVAQEQPESEVNL